MPSGKQIDRAGKILRKFASGDLSELDLVKLGEAFDVLTDWRAAHAMPLQKATMGLRSRVSSSGCSVRIVSQRLKRVPTIIDKLRREPSMALSRMADIGGCRAILNSIEDVRRVQRRWEDTAGRVKRVKDYIESPRDSGYRAVHLIVQYNDRSIEVQLRTRVMHEWAFTVETMTGRLGMDIKGGDGPPPVQDWFRAVSQAMAYEERDQTVPAHLLHEIATLRERAVPILTGGGWQ
ncbi:RelA/SpoT domain-containing protein [Nocardia cyriacigeorgica]|uniref:RelA/SpoT domain-containing protein n=1 Tax=Nocardia cyriacigeorgica TaxID=135487 RepID=UPI002B4B6AE1|nr:RelA/SpoT domain-containing protein [Nocardia cyriacigeorgica]